MRIWYSGKYVRQLRKHLKKWLKKFSFSYDVANEENYLPKQVCVLHIVCQRKGKQ